MAGAVNDSMSHTNMAGGDDSMSHTNMAGVVNDSLTLVWQVGMTHASDFEVTGVRWTRVSDHTG
jgi:hypothetical protein